MNRLGIRIAQVDFEAGMDGLQMERLMGLERSTAPASADAAAAAAAARPMLETARRGSNNFMVGEGIGW